MPGRRLSWLRLEWHFGIQPRGRRTGIGAESGSGASLVSPGGVPRAARRESGLGLALWQGCRPRLQIGTEQECQGDSICVHAVTSLGVFDSKGAFHSLPESFDFSPLVELFREQTFQRLLAKEKITPERVAMLRTWKHSVFQVLSERRVQAHDRKGLESLLHYMERSPVSLDRLSSLDDGRVLYRGNYHPSLGRHHQIVSALEFLALLVPHIATCSSYYTSSGTREHASEFPRVPP